MLRSRGDQSLLLPAQSPAVNLHKRVSGSMFVWPRFRSFALTTITRSKLFTFLVQSQSTFTVKHTCWEYLPHSVQEALLSAFRSDSLIYLRSKGISDLSMMRIMVWSTSDSALYTTLGVSLRGILPLPTLANHPQVIPTWIFSFGCRTRDHAGCIRRTSSRNMHSQGRSVFPVPFTTPRYHPTVSLLFRRRQWLYSHPSIFPPSSPQSQDPARAAAPILITFALPSTCPSGRRWTSEHINCLERCSEPQRWYLPCQKVSVQQDRSRDIQKFPSIITGIRNAVPRKGRPIQASWYPYRRISDSLSLQRKWEVGGFKFFWLEVLLRIPHICNINLQLVQRMKTMLIWHPWLLLEFVSSFVCFTLWSCWVDTRIRNSN